MSMFQKIENWLEKYIHYEYLIQINYKSGNHFTAWFKELDIVNGRATWTIPNFKKGRPVVLGIDDIESIWTVKTRFRLGKS